MEVGWLKFKPSPAQCLRTFNNAHECRQGWLGSLLEAGAKDDVPEVTPLPQTDGHVTPEATHRRTISFAQRYWGNVPLNSLGAVRQSGLQCLETQPSNALQSARRSEATMNHDFVVSLVASLCKGDD